MYKSCSKCGKIHDSNYRCTAGYKRIYADKNERKLRSSYAWTMKSKQVREYANYLCEVCRDQGIYTVKDVEVHHIKKLRDDEQLFLDDSNLICLCVMHHKQADDGELDESYLKQLSEARQARQGQT